MGNGRWSGRTSDSSLRWIRACGAAAILVAAGSGLVGFGSLRRGVTVTPKRAAASPISTFPRSFSAARPNASAILGQLPLIFEPNQGQADASAKFVARGAGYSLFLDERGALLGVPNKRSAAKGEGSLVRMRLVGSDPAATARGTNLLPGKSNYLIGNDRRKWHSGVPQFGGVLYGNVYPGIDLVFYGNQGRLEYDFKIAPGADPSRAELQFDGAKNLAVKGGDLVLGDGGLRLQAPQIYQRDGDRRIPVAGHFAVRAPNRVGFVV